MAQCKPRAGLRTSAARTTVLRDYCRQHRRARYLTRGGRTRTSIWWRAWLAKLLGDTEAPPGPPPTPPVPIQAILDDQAQTLAITFDATLDPGSTAVATRFRYGDGIEMHIASGPVTISGATLSVSIITPPQLPFGSGAWFVTGAGELLGANGAAVQPFGPV